MSTAECSILAIDIGSSSIKAAFIGTDGSVLVNCKVPLPIVANGDRVEIDADVLWQAFVQSIRSLRQEGYTMYGCTGIGITSQMAGLVMLGGEGKPVRDFILGVDRRGTSYVNELNIRLKGSDIYSRTGCPLSGIYPSSKLLCLQVEEPEILKQVHFIGGIKEYLLWKLTGSWVTDPASASATQLYDQQCREWWPEMLQAVGLSLGQMPHICNPDGSAGALLTEVSRELDLPAAIPVIVGTGDGPAANLSSGSVTRKQLCISLGTTAVTRFWSDGTEAQTEEGRYFRQHFGWEMYLEGYRMEGAGSRISEFLTLPVIDGKEVKSNSAIRPAEGQRDNEAGELQAVLDDILFTLYELMESLVVQGRFQEIRPIGGGRLNESWMQDIADLFQLPVILSEGGDSTLGAAMIVVKHLDAGAAWEEISNRMVRVIKVINPHDSMGKAIHKRYETYRTR